MGTWQYKKFDYVGQPITLEAWIKKNQIAEELQRKNVDSRNPMPIGVNTIANLMIYAIPGFIFYRRDTLNIMPTHVGVF